MNFQRQVYKSICLRHAGLGFLNGPQHALATSYSPTPTAAEIRVPVPSGGWEIS